MSSSAPQTFRVSLFLLTAANLAALGVLLWPWQGAMNLPLNGTTAIDPAVLTRPWKQCQGLAIGNSAAQGLVHALNSATALLLLGSLAGAAVGLIFAYFRQSSKS
jgi:hypothetical protein